MRQVWGSAWKGAQDQLESEREAHASAEREAAELRVQVATLTERTARVDELHAMVEKLK